MGLCSNNVTAQQSICFRNKVNKGESVQRGVDKAGGGHFASPPLFTIEAEIPAGRAHSTHLGIEE